MHKAIGLFVLLWFLSAQSLFVCRENECDFVKCKCLKYDDCKKPNQDVRRGGWCGCCFICYTSLGENETCPFQNFLGGPPPTSGCAKGLTCYNGTCQREA
ncbi:hypothetical protein WA026_020050 [Henosepilachna vigintioctopunctata]|uniref:Uncharacterized protein n=1 Tax=Henosepilachna vigintioctopunctata TaxID=420089 RepID=A0AAW1UA85_9CUCU